MRSVAVVLFIAFAVALGWKADYTGYAVQRCSMVNEEKADLIRGIISALNVETLSRRIESVDVMIEPKYRELFDGLHCEVIVPDVQKQIEVENKRLLESREYYLNNFNDSDVYHKTYHPYNEIVAKVQEIASKYPQVVRISSLGRSIENRDIPVVHITGTSGTTKKSIYINGGIHAREWISAATVVYIIQTFAEKYGNDQEVTNLLNEVEFAITPMSNPDGYSYTWDSDRMWRKNRNTNDGNTCKGVDLNRNFDVFWGTGSSNNKCAEDYHGSGPASEPEVAGIQNYILNLKNRIGAIDIHSYGQYIMRPYGWTYDLHPDEAQLKVLGDSIAAAIKDTTGTSYSSIRSAELYPVSGASDDWFTVELDLWGFCFELRDRGLYGFRLPESQILGTAQEIYAAVKTYASFVLDNFVAKQ